MLTIILYLLGRTRAWSSLACCQGSPQRPGGAQGGERRRIRRAVVHRGCPMASLSSPRRSTASAATPTRLSSTGWQPARRNEDAKLEIIMMMMMMVKRGRLKCTHSYCLRMATKGLCKIAEKEIIRMIMLDKRIKNGLRLSLKCAHSSCLR